MFTLNWFKIIRRDRRTDKDIYIYAHIINSLTPIIGVNGEGVSSGYAENPDKFDFSLKIGYIGSYKWKQRLQTAILGYVFIYEQIKH